MKLSREEIAKGVFDEIREVEKRFFHHFGMAISNFSM